jgi:hypothetical protein
MLPQPESACFVITDISGYTGFLAGVELEHAQDIIADVMDTMVRRLRPPFRLAKFEGDAAFFYAVADKVDGSVLQDAVEAAYFAFRKRLRNISQATSCACNACTRMQDLDLKFVCHHGEFIKQKMSGRDELAGRDVILVHRLLKNGVNERLGGHAYALFSEPCIRAMGMDPAAQGLIEHRETIDIIGEVTCWVRNLEAAWQQEKDRQMNQVTREAAAAVIEFDIAAPRPAVWEHFTLPGLRPKWRAADEVRENSQSGRRGVGTVNHCMHGPHDARRPQGDHVLRVPRGESRRDAYRDPAGEVEAEGPGVSRSCRRGISEDHHGRNPGKCWKDRTGRRPRSKNQCCRCRRSAS